MFQRNIKDNLLEALSDTPVVVIHGARQTGKSTMVRMLAQDDYPAQYLTFDDLGVLGAARSDPVGFLAGLKGPVILDEVQRVPELFLSIKAEVDRDRRPGRFLLTGSSQVLNLPRLADTLAGRVEILTLWPLSQGEIEGVKEGFIDALFADELPDLAKAKETKGNRVRESLVSRMLAGGYPEAVSRSSAGRRRAWFESYLNTILQRDVRDLANITGLADLPRLLAVLAARAGGLLNYVDLARDAGLNQMTFKRYFALLDAVFLVKRVHPWFTNRIKRLTKSQKVYLGDVGLLAHLLDLTAGRLERDPRSGGAFLENFVATELMKQRTWSRTHPEIFHFRTYAGTEVDFVIEARGGRRLVGVEVKASATVGPGDFNGLRLLSKSLGKQFHRGVVLHAGTDVIPFGKNLYALPVSALWRMAAE